MEILFQRQAIEEASAAVNGISSENNVLPLLANVLIIAKENSKNAELIASNMDSFIRCFVPAEIKEPGVTTVPAQKFHQIISEFPDDNVIFKYDGTRVTITCQENCYKLATLPPDDFPKWPEPTFLTEFEAPQAELKKAVSYQLFAIAVSDPRKVLLGGLFELKDNMLKTVSTDGRKLSYYDMSVPEISGQPNIKAIVPHKFLAEFHKYLKEEGSVRIKIAKNQISFSFGSFEYISTLIEGTYPNYENVIPKEFMTEAFVDCDAFGVAIRRAAVLTNEKSYGIIMKFSKNKVEMQSNIYDLGSFDGYCVLNYSGPDFAIAFNYKNFMDILRLFGKCEIEMKFKGLEAPVVLNPKGVKNAFFIVMPIKLAEIVRPDAFSNREEDAAVPEAEDEREGDGAAGADSEYGDEGAQASPDASEDDASVAQEDDSDKKKKRGRKKDGE